MGNITNCAKVRPEKQEIKDREEMPFWKKDNDAKSNKPKEKVNYKARFEHKQYLVRFQVFKMLNEVEDGILFYFNTIASNKDYFVCKPLFTSTIYKQ